MKRSVPSHQAPIQFVLLLLLLLVAACLLSACQATKSSAAAHKASVGSSDSTARSEAKPAAARVFPAKANAEISSAINAAMDKKVDPCQDFFRYACGSWIDATPIPPDETAWARGFSEIQKRNEEMLRSILDDAVVKDPHHDAGLEKLGRYYGACMDQTAINKEDIAPLKPYLARVDAVRSPKDVMKMAGELHAIGADPLFGMQVLPDFKNPTIEIALFEQGGLGLFDRDYYLKDDDASKQLRDAYQGHVAKMLTLSGESEADAKADASRILAFETELAKVSRPRVDLRDPEKNYHKVDISGLEKLAPALPWEEYTLAIGAPTLTQLSVGQPEFYEGLSKIVPATDPATVRAYLRWNLVHNTARFLSEPLVQENFAFYGQILSGQKEIKPRWKRCVAGTDEALGELLGQYYVERAFPGDSKKAAVELIQRIESAFQANLKDLGWMDEETRKRAVEKLQAVANKIGYPDRWRDYGKLTVKPGDYFDNALAAQTFEFNRQVAKVGKPVDKKEWGLTPPSVNAYYNPLNNEMVFPAGIMQPPFFDHEFPAPMAFGGIGMVMGHELTHGYDDEGRKFDPSGRLQEWWAPSASEKFEKQAKCVSDLYSTFEAQPGLHVNGEMTLGENIADLGGVKEAYVAYKTWESQTGQTAPALQGMTNDQLFFVGFAQAWCSSRTPEFEKLLINLDFHSPDQFRVNGSLANFPQFGETFACKVGSPMRPQHPCTVW